MTTRNQNLIHAKVKVDTIPINSKKINQDELFFKIIRNLEGLDIIISIHLIGYYTLSNASILQDLSLDDVARRLSLRNLTFNEIKLERDSKKNFGFYGNKVIKLFLNNLISDYIGNEI